LAKELISSRTADVQPFVRKAVYSNLAQESSSVSNEIRLACNIKELKLIQTLFSKGICDDSKEVSQEAL